MFLGFGSAPVFMYFTSEFSIVQVQVENFFSVMD